MKLGLKLEEVVSWKSCTEELVRNRLEFCGDFYGDFHGDSIPRAGGLKAD